MTLWQDIRTGWRALRLSPSLVIVAVVSLAFGIGANTLVFSTARALLFRPLPVPDSGRLFVLQASGGINQSFPNYLDIRERSSKVADLVAYRVTEAALDAGAGARSSWGYLSTGSYFTMLGLQPAAGRFFTAAEDVGRNAAPLMVLSHDYWLAAFNGDRRAVGRTVTVNGRPYTVVGVAPRGFVGTEVFFRPDFWVPMTMAPQLEGGTWIDSRSARNVFVAGRLRSGVTRQQAIATFETIATRLAREYPAANANLRFSLAPPGLFGDLFRPQAEAFVGVTLVLSMLMLLAACANLANLLAARVVDRFRELAIRLALGATRRILIRQLMVETMLLCLIGGAAGLAVAFVPLRMLTGWRPAPGLPLALDVMPDVWVLACGMIASVASALIAVAAAARRAWRTDPTALMNRSSDSVRIGGWALRDVLLGVQVAACSLLLTSAVVAGDGLNRTLATRLGFNPDGMYVASFDLNQAGYDQTRGVASRTRLLERIAALPGVNGVTFTSSIPLTTDQSTDTLIGDDASRSDASKGVEASAFIVPSGYFATMQTRLVAGREFAATDSRVVIVNEALAMRLFGRTDVVGRTLRGAPTQPPLRIIAVAEDGKYAVPGEAPRPAVFWNGMRVYRSSTQLLVRSSLPEQEVARSIRRVAAELEPMLPVTFQGTLREVSSLAFLPAAAAATILSALGGLAVVLALTGVYGLAAYSVSARTREIGIRVAVGARSGHVLRTVLGRTGVVLIAAGGAGVLLASAASSALALVVYQASSRDPRVLVTGATMIVLIGLAAAWIPARRALRIDPALTVREG
jgi:predicted permease